MSKSKIFRYLLDSISGTERNRRKAIKRSLKTPKTAAARKKEKKEFGDASAKTVGNLNEAIKMVYRRNRMFEKLESRRKRVQKRVVKKHGAKVAGAAIGGSLVSAHQIKVPPKRRKRTATTLYQ